MKTRRIDKRALRASIARSSRTIGSLAAHVETIAAIGRATIRALNAGGKVLTAGNGGSAAEALHMAEELVGRFKSNRRSLPAVALVADSTALTCIGNDFGFDEVFRRQLGGLGKRGDMLFLLSTSGTAMNLQLALDAARSMEIATVAFLGRDGGPLAGRADYEIIVRGSETARIQEAHQVLVHLVLEMVEGAFSGKS